MDNQKIDILKLKVNPLLLEHKVKLIEQSQASHKLVLAETLNYENGLQIMKFNIIYASK